jgi:predicted RNase H-like HicB family nuclease
LRFSCFNPIAIAFEHRISLAKLRWKITPWATSSRNPKYSFEKLAVAATRPPRITGLAQTIRLHLRPLGVCEHQSIHGKLLLEFESRLRRFVNPESQQTLEDLCRLFTMIITFETEQEVDGLWIAEVPELAGVMAYGASERQAIGKAEALALRVLAERIKHVEAQPMLLSILVAAE